ncbi:MAG TPA: hypothetical protein DCS07_10170 [Bdellovibrionales bacterium]|nr:MAG: hypothetical protein A2Z97_09300 [Bdellovibrionales bacterium GWB1_52_6]OFZ04134.1 MAG: hypothetical protein A2X97_15150 [Bdellovibrionales bacterium GWA1_52_35]OFZ33214.1 MAG: hypothetical protein A2070_01200 [Bdellovibrionales bacterium GWC1_52_8]HAR42976.1 hypothetical protein [Bdellovibrionales bacterium]HCM40474.1 hypothetical protein [Bdellovibrionales bacterium]
MKFPLYVLLFFLVTSATSGSANALISSEATLSGGYYQDSSERSQTPVFFYWNLNHTAANGIETYFDLGANNNLLENRWGFYLYQGYFTIPFSSGFETAPSKKSRIQLGRQLLTEGFEMDILDGVQVPFYWSENGGVNLHGGASYFMQQDRYDTHSQIYGATAHQKLFGGMWKGGYLHKTKSFDTPAIPTAPSFNENYAHASVMYSFERLPFHPFLLAKSQWNLQSRTYDQGYGELSFYPRDSVSFGATYSKRQPSALDALDTLLVFRIFSISPVFSTGGFITFTPKEDLRFQANLRHSLYSSPAGAESGDEQELTATWLHGRATWIPGVAHVKSYGGEFWEPSLTFRFDFTNTASLRVQGAIADIKKINGIQAKAYSGRAGMDFRPLPTLAPRLSALVLGEAESNHIFKVDGRVIAFLSYLLY